MYKALIFLLVSTYLIHANKVFGDQPEEILSKPNLDGTLIREEFPPIYFIQGSSFIDWEDKDRIVNEIVIQYNKLGAVLGRESLTKYASSDEAFSIAVISHDELDELIGSFGANAATIDGVIYITPTNISPHILRHEVLHALVYALIKNKMPWWMEEGLAQVLSGELEEGNIAPSKTNIERKYQDARQRVMRLVNKCGFNSFGRYLSLLEDGNTERYSFNKVFNELCENAKE